MGGGRHISSWLTSAHEDQGALGEGGINQQWGTGEGDAEVDVVQEQEG